jgi:hypothetical protein
MAALPVALFTVADALTTVGFNNEESASLNAEAFPTFDSFKGITEADIKTIETDYGKRAVANGRIIFGFHRTKLLTGLMHWMQDQWRKGTTPEEEGLINVNVLSKALVDADIRKNMAENQDTSSKAADPGKHKINTDYYTWIAGFTNYLGTIPGMTGIPLAYVIRKSEVAIEEDDADYLTDLINRAPLVGPVYQADRRQVHMLVTGKVLGEPAAEWIRDIERHKDGRRDIMNLTLHYTGEGNVSRRITVAQQLFKTLHYKSERSMPFSKFLIQAQTMFQIYQEEGEEITGPAKLRWLFEKVQAPHLQSAKGAMEFQSSINRDLSYTTVANHFMTQVMQSSDFALNRRVSEITTGTGGRGRGRGRGRGTNSGNTNGRAGKGYRAGRGGRGRYGGRQQNSVQQNENTSITYSKSEWWSKTPEERSRIQQAREESKRGPPQQISTITSTPSVQDASVAPSTAGTAFGGRSEVASAKRARQE